MKTPWRLRPVPVALVLMALAAGLAPMTGAAVARAPMEDITLTMYGNVNAIDDLVFSDDAIWATNRVGLIRWNREGEYQREVRRVEKPAGEEVALEPWLARTDGAVVSPTRMDRLIVDGQDRLWSVGSWLRLLDAEYNTAASIAPDDTWALLPHYDALLNAHYINPEVMGVDKTRGWLWFLRSRYGLVAFDGKNLLDWRDQSPSRANAIYINAAGEVWAAGYTNEIYRYRHDDNTWDTYHYAEDMGLAPYPWDQLMFSFQTDAQGRTWVSTGAGVARFDPASGQWQAFGEAQGIYGFVRTEVHIDAEGTTWALTGWMSQRQLARLNADETAFEPVARLPDYFAEPETVQESPRVLQVGQVTGMRTDPQGQVWIMTEIGALHWNGEAWEVLRVGGPSIPAWRPRVAVANAPNLADAPILFVGGSTKVRLADAAETWPAFSEDPFYTRDVNVPGLSFGTVGADGNVYALRERAHLWTVDEGEWIEIGRANDPGSWDRPLNQAVMNDLAVAADGTAWMSDPYGLWHWSKGEWTFFGQEQGLPVHQGSRILGTALEQVELDGDGTLWLLTAAYRLQFDNYPGFLVKYDGETFQVVDDLPFRYLGNTGEPLRYDPVTGLLWLRDLRDLRAYDPAGGTWQVADLSALGEGATLRDMAPTGDGGVWVVTGEGKLFRYQDDVFEGLALPAALTNVGRVAVDPQGNTWVTGIDGGAAIWDGSAWTVEAQDALAGGRYRDMVFLDDEVWLLGQHNVDYRKGDGAWTALYAPPYETDGLLPATTMVDTEGVLWYADSRGIARYVDGAWDVVVFYGADMRGSDTFDLVKLDDGTLWLANRLGVGVFDGVEWAFFAYGTSAPIVGFRGPEWVPDAALGGEGNRVFFGATENSFNLRMYSPDITYWMRFPSSVELRHPVTDMELGPDGRLWFGSGRVAYLDDSDKMWSPPSAIQAFSNVGVKRISHGSADILWVLGDDTLFDKTRTMLARCDWFNCDWTFLDPSLQVFDMVATSAGDVWLNGEGWLLHASLGQPQLEPEGGYLRQEAVPTPVRATGGGATSFGSAQVGGLTPEDPFDQWSFDAGPGDVVSILVEGVRADSTVSVNLFDADHGLIAFANSQNGALELLNRELGDGRYSVVVNLEAGPETGYTLYVYK